MSGCIGWQKRLYGTDASRSLGAAVAETSVVMEAFWVWLALGWYPKTAALVVAETKTKS